MKPIDISVTPWAWRGIMVFPSGEDGRFMTPIILGCDGP